MPDLPSILAGGNAILVLGDLGDTKSAESSLTILRHKALEALGLPEETHLDLGMVMKSLASEKSQLSTELITQHLARSVASNADIVRVIQAPWDRIYSVSGLNLDSVEFARLKHPVSKHSARFSIPEAAQHATLLIDESPVSASEYLTFIADGGADPEQKVWIHELRTRALTAPLIGVANASDHRLYSRLATRDLQGHANQEAVELPPCILYLATVRPEDEVFCRALRITLIHGTLSDLASQLPPGHMKLIDARKKLLQSRQWKEGGVGAKPVSALLRDVEEPRGWDFLRGFDPTWPDIHYQRPVRLRLAARVRSVLQLTENQRNTVVVQARTGAAKTTTLMTLAHDLIKQGRSVVWIDRSATQRTNQLLDEVGALDPDVVMVDDADMFGDAAPRFLRHLNQNGKRAIVASVRTTRVRSIGSIENSSRVEEESLTDNELRDLHDLLEGAGLLGSLQGVHPMATRMQMLEEKCQRDLLAALIEIVTGQKFEDRIVDEFNQLTKPERAIYQVLAVFVAHVAQARSMPKEELVQVLAPVEGYASSVIAIQSLLEKRILVEDGDSLRVRHVSIARALVERLEPGALANSIESLLRYYAGRAHGIRDSAHPLRRTMIALLSHTLLVALRIPLENSRAIYAAVQPLLSGDFHYWLQRGAFETELGDKDIARSYLKSARACPGGESDYKVSTEIGMLALRRAIERPGDPDALAEAIEAMKLMFAVARQQGSNSPHTFKVLAQEGLEAHPN